MGLLDLFSGKPASPGVSPPPQGLMDLLLGTSNPISQFVDSRQNTLGAIGSGLAAGPTFAQGLSNAAQNIPQARKADYSMGLYRGQVSQTVQYLQKNHPDIAQAVQSGVMSPSDGISMAMQQDNTPLTPVAPGATPTYLSGPKAGQTRGGPDNNSFIGTDEKTQAWNTVMKANAPGADPALKLSPKFQAAWSIINTPVQTPQGTYQPPIPANWGAAPPAQSAQPGPSATGAVAAPSPSYAPPGGGSPSPAGASLQDMSMIAPPANVQQAPGVIPGTQPFQETQQRTGFLAGDATPDLKRVITGYPALMNFKDQAAGMLPGDLGRVLQSPAYKQAKDAMNNSMVDILYFASGANINKDEWARKVEAFMPSVGDDPQTAVNKLDRYANAVISMANASKDADKIAWAQQAVAGLKDTEQQILSQGKPVAPPAASGQMVQSGAPIWGPDGKQYVMGPNGQPVPVM